MAHLGATVTHFVVAAVPSAPVATSPGVTSFVVTNLAEVDATVLVMVRMFYGCYLRCPSSLCSPLKGRADGSAP